jgi:hypothetical protein
MSSAAVPTTALANLNIDVAQNNLQAIEAAIAGRLGAPVGAGDVTVEILGGGNTVRITVDNHPNIQPNDIKAAL